MDEQRTGQVLVVGAGVAGIRAALDLAQLGHRVLLAESSPTIGGILSKLDHQFPSNHCGMCRMLPLVGREEASQFCLRKGLFHDNIELLPSVSLEAVRGEPGDFQIDLVRQPRYVNTEVCNCGGRCTEVCPVEVPDELNHGLTRRKALYRPVPHSLPNLYHLDERACTRCGECVRVCPTQAIDLGARPERFSRAVEAIVLAAGAGMHDPSADPEESTRYLASEQVLTALAFERLLSPSGGLRAGVLRRPDGKPARSIAWLQCIGSRQPARGRDTCSTVCCAFALKQAVLAREKGGPGTETTIFCMDLRLTGKGHARALWQAEQQSGVRLVHCRVHEVMPLSDGSVRLRAFDEATGTTDYHVFDLVVLSTDLPPGEHARELARITGTDELPAPGLDKTRTSRAGVFECGTFVGPADIAETVASASAAAGAASRFLHSLGRGPLSGAAPTKEWGAARARVRIAALLCRCDRAEGRGLVKLSEVEATLRSRPTVGAVHQVDALCTKEGAARLIPILKQSGCNRVLVGACLPEVHQARLRSMASQAGVEPTALEVIDLVGAAPGHCPLRDSEAATREAVQRLHLGLEEHKAADTPSPVSIPVVRTALVVGGGVIGLTAALSLAARGIQAHVVERTGELGGRLNRRAAGPYAGTEAAELVRELQARVRAHALIQVHHDTQVIANQGSLGRFSSILRDRSGGEIRVEHGVTILATGGVEGRSLEYGLGQSEQVLTSAELEECLADGRIRPEGVGTVVMIQCVGSREPGARFYCSRVCCVAALTSALRLRRENPELRVLVLYRDIMTWGAHERVYTEARNQGILFARYALDQKPRVDFEDGRPVVRFVEPLLQQTMEVRAELVVLSTGIEPDASAASLARIFRIELDESGFFREAEAKWRPVESSRRGVFVAGVAQGPQRLPEAIAQAEACAHGAYVLLARPELAAPRVVSTVRHARCSRCKLCIEACPCDARRLDPADDRVSVDPLLCEGCGLCAAACPNSATDIAGFGQDRVMARLSATLLCPGDERRA